MESDPTLSELLRAIGGAFDQFKNYLLNTPISDLATDFVLLLLALAIIALFFNLKKMGPEKTRRLEGRIVRLCYRLGATTRRAWLRVRGRR